MKRLECGVFWMLLATIVLTGLPAFATTQTTADLAAWKLALSNIYTYQSFDGLTTGTDTGGLLVANPTPGDPMGGLWLTAFRGADHADTDPAPLNILAEGTNPDDWKYWGGTGSTPRILQGQTYDAVLDTGFRITFTSSFSIYAVFLDVMISGVLAENGGSAKLVAGTSAGLLETTVTTQPRPTRSYFGVLSDVPITYLDVLNLTASPSGTSAIIDNVYYSTALPTLGGGPPPDPPPGETAEPITLLLIGSGLVAFRIMRRFQHRLA